MQRLRLFVLACAATLAAHAQSASWNGFYAGLTLGQSSYTSAWTDVDGYRSGATLEASKQPSQKAAVLGYNYQSGSTVFGLEFDRTLSSVDMITGYDQGSILRQDNLRNLTSLRLRAGLVYGTTLVYLTGGRGMAKVDHTWTDSGASGQSWPTFSFHQKGLIAGVGIEDRLDTNFTLRAEYLAYRSGAGSDANSSAYTMSVTDTLDTLRIGLIYCF